MLRVFGYFRLLRPLNCAMSSVAIFIGGFLLLWKLQLFAEFPMFLILAMVAGFLITGAGNAINDYVDVEADRINRPKRPIPSGKVKPKTALGLSLVLFAAGILLTVFINWITLIIALFNSLLLVVYSYHLQNKTFLGNGAVAYLVGSSFLFGGASALSPSMGMGVLILPLLLMALAGLANFSREIVKDLEDMEGDKLGFLKRFGTRVKKGFNRFVAGKSGARPRFGEKEASITAVVALVLTLAVSPLPYLLDILGIGYLLILAPTDICFVGAGAMLVARMKKKYSLASKTIKLGMLFGLAAFLIGVLV